MNERNTIIIVLVIVGIIALWYAANKQPSTTEYDARNFVLTDAQTQYPEAEVGVENVSYSEGSWKMKVRVTMNSSTMCPTRIHMYYDYPAMQFATRPPEYITKNCRICLNVQECVVIFPEEALIASYTFPGTEVIARFLGNYPNAVGAAEFRQTYGDRMGVWVVTWDSRTADGGVRWVAFDQQGRIVDVK